MVSGAITQCGDKYKDIEETQKAASSQNKKKNTQTWTSWPDLYKIKYPAMDRCKDVDVYNPRAIKRMYVVSQDTIRQPIKLLQ